ncbi:MULTISPECIES: NUDIX domain-containing protein [Paenibacillus]
MGFPKGHLESGEIWEDSAVREIFEETEINQEFFHRLAMLNILS